MSALSFDKQVPDNGYHWWYLDAVSDDNEHALTVIVFIGSVFSPYYARARKRGNVLAGNHCAVNVALYGRPWRWSMTERTQTSVVASSRALSIGKSTISNDGKNLKLVIDEIAVPLPSRIRGELNIELPGHHLQPHALDSDNGRHAGHFWQPIAPQTRINVVFGCPNLRWQGSAYVDSNYGNAPLESSFKSWEWSRSHSQDGSTRILYDVVNRQGSSSQHSLRYAADGTLSTCVAEQPHTLPSTRYWRIPRHARTPDGVHITELQTLEDTPFYSRSRFHEKSGDRTQVTVHESLYLERFDTAWVRCLLPFRMPRSTRPVLLV